MDLNRLGAVVTKGVANVPWAGNPTPRVAETYGGMLNAIGLQNPGIDVFLDRDVPFLQKYDTKIIVNVCGKTVEDYLEVVEKDVYKRQDEMLARNPYPDKYMELKVGGSDIRLGYHNIIYAEHFAHMINVHTTAGKTISTRQTFKTFTEKLKEESRFFICGRGVIVNLEHASDFENEAFCMEDGSRIYVNKELLKSARQAFMEFLLQRGYQS